MDLTRQVFTLSGLREAYRSGVTPEAVGRAVAEALSLPASQR